jgi:hypothetical protein
MERGGSYIIGPEGIAVREGGTEPHPEGEAPRQADGSVILPTPPAPSGQED